MAVVQEYKINFYFEDTNHKRLSVDYVDTIQLTTVTVDAVNGRNRVTQPTYDQIKTILTNNGRTYPNGTLVVVGVALISNSVDAIG